MCKKMGDIVRGDGVPIYSPTCPHCNTAIHMQTAVDEFMQPPGWEFYGQQGKRVKACEGEFMGYSFVHFAVKLPAGISNRLTWILQAALDEKGEETKV